MSKTYGYVRCSTDETKQDLERQVREISKNRKIDYIYKEYGSGAKLNKELRHLLDIVRPGDTIIATEVSRLSRNTKDFIEITELVKNKGLRLEVGSMILDCTDGKDIDPITTAMLNMVAVFSELERQFISQRVKSGMANAKAKGKKVGRPQFTVCDIPEKFIKDYQKQLKTKVNITHLAKNNNLSRVTTRKYIKMLKETY